MNRGLRTTRNRGKVIAELGELLVFSGVVGDLLESRLNDCCEHFNDLTFWNGKFGQFNVIRDDGIKDRARRLDVQVMDQLLGEKEEEHMTNTRLRTQRVASHKYKGMDFPWSRLG